MSAVGWIAALMAVACAWLLVLDLRARRTAFAQFAASHRRHPSLFWIGIAGWAACLAGCLLVVLKERPAADPCAGEENCVVITADRP